MQEINSINRLKELNKAISVEDILSKPIQLSAKDKKIIFELTKNAKLPINKIAKKVALSRENTTYRIDRLIKLGIIQGFSTQINLSNLGIHRHYLLLKLKNFHPQFETELTEFVNKNPNILTAARYLGEYELIIEIASKSLIEFNEIVKTIRDFCSENIRDYRLINVVKEDKLITSCLGTIGIKTKEIFANKKYIENKIIDEENFSKKQLDEKDKQILKSLAINCRTPSTKIGAQVGLSNDGVISRIKKMESSGTITNFTGIFSFQKLGVQWHVILLRLKNLTKEREKSFRSFVMTHPYLSSLTKVNGNFDYITVMYSENNKQYYKIIEELRKNFSEIIDDYISLLGLKEYKYQENPIDLL
jgi:DNA-binding Lrp family transcriptional regulator